jgi:pimeloyl-ACP methyl ester carboxylesterase
MSRKPSLLVVVFFCALVALLLLSGCIRPIRGPGSKVPYEVVGFNASDNLSLVVSYYHSTATKGIILVPMAGRDRHSYDKVAIRLQPSYKVVSLDLRGHGQSDGDAMSFTDKDYRNMLLDIDAAARFLEIEGVPRNQISLVGASIGANLVLIYASEHPVDKLVLLSPGSRLRGLDLTGLVYSKPLLAQVGHYDAYSSISVEEISGNWPQGRVMTYDVQAHGTDLLDYDLSAMEDFVFYLT